MLRRVVIRFLRDENGATAIEYGLVVAMVAVGAIVAMTTLGNSVIGLFTEVQDKAGGAMDAADGN